MNTLKEISNSKNLVASLQQKYNNFLSELDTLNKVNPQLAQSLKIGPAETEWRPANTFKYRDFVWNLADRLDSFKRRLIQEYPKYKDIITLYCDLFLNLEINPVKINKAEEISNILNTKLDK